MIQLIEKNYAMCIEWTKLSERENRSSTTQQLHRHQDNKNWNYFIWKCVYNFYSALVMLE